MATFVRTALFVVVVLGIGFAIGASNLPGGWYASLAKPPFNPPNWVFAPVWSVIYLLIALAGARTFARAPRGAAMGWWAAQMLLNFAWSPVFFTSHRPGAALAVIVAMLVAITAFIAVQWRADRIAAALFLPYLAWVAFATLLNASIVALN